MKDRDREASVVSFAASQSVCRGTGEIQRCMLLCPRDAQKIQRMLVFLRHKDGFDHKEVLAAFDQAIRIVGLDMARAVPRRHP